MNYSTSRLTLYAVVSAIEDDLRRALLFHLGAEGVPKVILGDVLYARSLEPEASYFISAGRFVKLINVTIPVSVTEAAKANADLRHSSAFAE